MVRFPPVASIVEPASADVGADTCDGNVLSKWLPAESVSDAAANVPPASVTGAAENRGVSFDGELLAGADCWRRTEEIRDRAIRVDCSVARHLNCSSCVIHSAAGARAEDVKSKCAAIYVECSTSSERDVRAHVDGCLVGDREAS